MTRFETAIAEKQWEVVALYLLLGVSEAAALLPPESFSALLDLLGGEEKSHDMEARDRLGG